MELQSIISPPLELLDGIVVLPLQIVGLVPQVSFRSQTYYCKDEFHCSLVYMKCIQAGRADREPGQFGRQILEEIELARHRYHPEFLGYQDELRWVREGGDRSLIVMVTIGGLTPIYEHLRQRLNLELQSPPTHITLYTTPPNHGIAVPTQAVLEQITDPITGTELTELKVAMGLDRVRES